MWYVIQVKAGNEEKICSQCGRLISEDILGRCFVPYYESKKKINGKWEIMKNILFPGYIFVTVVDLPGVINELKKIPNFTKILKSGDEIVPISEREEEILRRFGLDKKHVLEMSEGIIEGDKVIVTDGALVGMEGYIRRIDRHKRKAWLEIDMFGRCQNIQMGLEIIERRE